MLNLSGNDHISPTKIGAFESMIWNFPMVGYGRIVPWRELTSGGIFSVKRRIDPTETQWSTCYPPLAHRPGRLQTRSSLWLGGLFQLMDLMEEHIGCQRF